MLCSSVSSPLAHGMVSILENILEVLYSVLSKGANPVPNLSFMRSITFP